MKLINEGAEAKIYSDTYLGIDVIVKDRIRKRYRIKEIDDALRAQRTKREARILYLASSHGINAPSVLLVDGTRLYIRRIYGTNLNEYTNGSARVPAQGLGRVLYYSGVYGGLLHNLDIAHGDYTPANMMLDKKGALWIIDFGLAETTKSIEEKALDILLMKRALPKALFEGFLRGYRESSNDHARILGRLAAIERRGRYQVRTLSTG